MVCFQGTENSDSYAIICALLSMNKIDVMTLKLTPCNFSSVVLVLFSEALKKWSDLLSQTNLPSCGDTYCVPMGLCLSRVILPRAQLSLILHLIILLLSLFHVSLSMLLMKSGPQMGPQSPLSREGKRYSCSNLGEGAKWLKFKDKTLKEEKKRCQGEQLRGYAHLSWPGPLTTPLRFAQCALRPRKNLINLKIIVQWITLVMLHSAFSIAHLNQPPSPRPTLQLHLKSPIFQLEQSKTQTKSQLGGRTAARGHFRGWAAEGDASATEGGVRGGATSACHLRARRSLRMLTRSRL